MFENKVNRDSVEGIAISECINLLETAGVSTVVKVGILEAMKHLYLEYGV